MATKLTCEKCGEAMAEGDLAWKWQPMRVVDGQLVGVVTVDEATRSTRVIGPPLDGCVKCTPTTHPDTPERVKDTAKAAKAEVEDDAD